MLHQTRVASIQRHGSPPLEVLPRVEPGGVDQGDEGKVERVAERDEPRRLLRRRDVERAGEVHRLVGDDPHRAARDGRERGHDVPGPTAAYLQHGVVVDDRLGDYPEILTDQLGLGERPLLGIAILGLAAAGAVIGVRRRPALDGPLLLIALGSSVAIGTHFRRVDRYWFQITPWVVYFCAVALFAVGALLMQRHRTIGRLVATVPLLAIVVAHLVVLPGRIGDAQDFNAAGNGVRLAADHARLVDAVLAGALDHAERRIYPISNPTRGEELALPNFGMETVHHVHAADVAQAFMKAMTGGMSGW